MAALADRLPAGGVSAPPAWTPGPDLDSAIGTVWNALTSVRDPRLCLDIVSLGLVYDVRVDDGTLIVEMTTNTPGCPVSGTLPTDAKAAVRKATSDSVPVHVHVVCEPRWDPSMTNEAAASALGFRVM